MPADATAAFAGVANPLAIAPLEPGATVIDVGSGAGMAPQALPLEDAVGDVVISNGVLNLTTDKLEAFGEVWRVLRPGGRLELGDIVVESELSEGIRRDLDLGTG